jgi:hypothetical protein
MDLLMLETIVAISALFHGAKEYKAFYAKHGESLNGFPGIWGFVALLSRAFVEAEEELRPNWDGEWIDAMDNFISTIYIKAMKVDQIKMSDETLKNYAIKAIKKSLPRQRSR